MAVRCEIQTKQTPQLCAERRLLNSDSESDSDSDSDTCYYT